MQVKNKFSNLKVKCLPCCTPHQTASISQSRAQCRRTDTRVLCRKDSFFKKYSCLRVHDYFFLSNSKQMQDCCCRCTRSLGSSCCSNLLPCLQPTLNSLRRGEACLQCWPTLQCGHPQVALRLLRIEAAQCQEHALRLDPRRRRQREGVDCE